MKRRTRTLLWALALVLLAAVLVWVNLPPKKAAPAARQGERLEDFTVRCLDGGDFTLSAQRGRVTVINLWATWCAPCVRELPGFDRLQRERPDDVAVLALHSPPVTADVEDWLSDYDFRLRFAVDADGSLSQALGASTVLPMTIIVDPDGVVTYRREGALTYDELQKLVAAAKGE